MSVRILNRFEPERLNEMKDVYHSVGWLKHTDEVISKILSEVISYLWPF